MKWHYAKDECYPKWYPEVIVKCEDCEVLKTVCSSYYDNKYYHHKSFAMSFYYDDCFDAAIGLMKWNNVVAWCYLYKEMEYDDAVGIISKYNY